MEIDRLLKLRDVVELTRMGKSTIYRKIAAGLFPKPVGLGGKSVRWRESDITRWMAALS
ncbi:MAG TPA: AlpA family phage regulatory protein [Fluviicoccus sp.]|nr:AlpA family phage regulatory protein [Fluviicoccus sp.]